MFNANNLEWTKMFILPRVTTYHTYLSTFQHNVLRNILFLNKNLYLFGITKSALCSYCKRNDVTPAFPAFTPQTAILGLFNDSVSNVRLINHILLLFKLYIYESQNKHRINRTDFLANILKVRKLEKVTAFYAIKMGYNK